jgi:hypothetical protein
MRKALLVSILVLLILGAAGSTVLAQDGGDKFVFGENFVLRSGEVLGGNLAVLGGTATLEEGSTVKGDVAVAGGRLIIAGTVEGSTAVLGGTADLAETAVIKGDFASFGGTANVASGATIEGESFGGLRSVGPSVEIPELPRLPEVPKPWVSTRPFAGLGQIITWQFATLGWTLMMLVLGVIALVVAPKPMSRIANAAATQPALCFGAGLLTVIVGILAGILLLIACCLGVFVWLALLIAIAVGWIAVGLWVGQRLLAALKVRDVSVLVEVALGVVLITILGRLPCCLGALFTAIVGSIGLGAVVLTRFGRQSLVAVGSASSAPPAQSLAEFDAEVLAPLALPVVAPEPMVPEPVVPEPEAPAESADPSFPGELLPPSESLVEPEAEPVDEAPLLPEDPADAITLDPMDGEPRPQVEGGEPRVQPTS